MGKMPTQMIFLLFFWLMLTASAQAHKVNVFAWVEGETVFTESKFSGGKLVKGGRITVLDADGTLLLEGVTDESGAFSFKAPKIADLTIVMEAGTGHKNSWKITAAELGGGAAEDATAMSGEGSPEPSGEKALSVAPGLDAREVEEIVARQLEEKLRPLNRMMAESRDRGPALSDIVGGVGYILGLIGLGAYIRYRKERGKP
jgi:nickel transport protein